MPTNVIMPQMGESIFEGTVTKWLKKLGDTVVRDEPLFEISTDKVDAEIPSPSAGVLTSLLVKEGETVQINTIVAVLDGEMGAGPTASAAPAADAVTPMKLPTDPEPAPAGSPSETKPGEAPEPEEAASEGAAEGAGDEGVRSSPLVRKLAKEHNVDLAQVTGSGTGGRITKQDVLDFVAGGGKSTKAVKPAAKTAPAPPPPAPPKPAPAIFTAPPPSAAPPASAAGKPSAPPTPAPMPAFSGPTRVEPMTKMREIIAQRMVESKHTAAHVSTVFQVDMSHVTKLRDKHKNEFLSQNGLKLTYTPFLVRAVVEAIGAWPIINSSIDGNTIVYKRDINVGIAVALDWGLIVPVVMHCEEKSFLGIARSITDLAERARSKKLQPNELQNGTFTVTNPGHYGQLFATPIINLPQVAILGVGKIQKAPLVVTDDHGNDSLAIRTVTHLTLSYDHRVIDGAVADQFMARVKHTLENWKESLG